MRLGVIDEYIDELDIAEYFEMKFNIEESIHTNGDKYGRISVIGNEDMYLQFNILPTHWYIETIRGVGVGSQLLLACFREAIAQRIPYIELNARTNDENIKTQTELEAWYRKFGFETIGKDVNGTKMRALSMSRPLEFRYKELVDRVLGISETI